MTWHFLVRMGDGGSPNHESAPFLLLAPFLAKKENFFKESDDRDSTLL
jgi:hypothetical protein